MRGARIVGRSSVAVVAAAVVLGTVSAAIYAVLNPPAPKAAPGPEACPQPPCMDLDLPSGVELLAAVTGLGLVVALLLGGLAAVGFVLSRPRDFRGGALVVLGPLVVLVAMELIPHVVNPCLVVSLANSSTPSWCEGSDVAGRWHALHHVVVGAVPPAMAYLTIIRRRRPELSPLGAPRRGEA